MNIEVRRVRQSDVNAILSLMFEFAEELEIADLYEADENSLSGVMFGEHPFVGGLLALEDSEPVGYVLFFDSFSSFRGQKGVFLEDIFVTKGSRGKGIGELLLSAVAKDAKNRDALRMDLLVSATDHQALEFYRKRGGLIDPNDRHCKFVDSAFKRISD